MEECDFVTEIKAPEWYDYLNKIHKFAGFQLLRKREQFLKRLAFFICCGIILALTTKEC